MRQIVSGDILKDNEAVDDENADDPSWIEIKNLKKKDFQLGFGDILKVVKKLNQ